MGDWPTFAQVWNADWGNCRHEILCLGDDAMEKTQMRETQVAEKEVVEHFTKRFRQIEGSQIAETLIRMCVAFSKAHVREPEDLKND